MRLELFDLRDGAVLARLHGIAVNMPSEVEQRMMERFGECRLPRQSISARFFKELGRDGWAVASGDDAALLRLVGYVVSRKALHTPGETLLEAAIGEACRDLQAV